jgi:hypothetical protein
VYIYIFCVIRPVELVGVKSCLEATSIRLALATLYLDISLHPDQDALMYQNPRYMRE